MTRAYQIWRDRRGRISAPRLATLALLLFPLLLALEAWLNQRLAARLINDLVHRSGYWALVFLLASLAITPLRRAARFAALIDVRRMIGVGAFLYATLHIGLYIADEKFDLVKVALEIVKRLYLTIGLIAWTGLLALAVTSSDSMVKTLGALRWRRLHRASYAIGLLALIHFFQQTKADFTLPATISGLFGWLMAYRLMASKVAEPTTPMLLALTLAVTLATFLGEAVGIALWYKVSPMAVLNTAFDFALAIRPGWYVLAAGLAICLLDFLRGRMSAGSGRGRGIGSAPARVAPGQVPARPRG